MPSIKVIFRESSRASGEGTLFFRVIHRRAMRQINTGCRLLRAEWDTGRECVIIAGLDSRKEYLRCVQMQLVKGRGRLLQIVSVLDKSGGVGPIK